MGLNLRFLGGASTVTGSKYLVEHQDTCVLIDSGLFQGYKQLRLRNRAPLGVEAGHIDAVLLGVILCLMALGLVVLYSASNAGWPRVSRRARPTAPTP